MQRMVLILLVVVSFRLCAQKEDYTWITGLPSVKIDFTSTGFTYDTTFAQDAGTYLFITSFTQNDSAGNLLYYTNGASVFDRHGNVMENGDGLNPSGYLNDLINSGVGNGCQQGAMGIKKPGSDSLYYLFSFTDDDSCSGFYGVPCRLYVTTINMKSNNGLGSVIEKNRVLIMDSTMTNSQMTLVMHGDGKDWWLIKQASIHNRYYKFLITEDGITGPYTQDMGTYPGQDNGQFGELAITPDGSRFVSVSSGQNLNIMNFDRCSGEFLLIDTFAIRDDSIYNNDTVSYGISVAFSPNSRFMYVNYIAFINQYDLCASSIKDSKVTLITLADTGNGGFLWEEMQLAPDGKIYIAPYDGFDYLSVINQPDSPGLACNFSPWSVGNVSCPPTKSPQCALTPIPLFPQYRLPALGCTTGIAQTTNALHIRYYPYLYVDDITAQTQLQVYNLLGQLIYSSSNYQNDWDVRKVANGVYVFQLGLPDGERYSGKVAAVH